MYMEITNESRSASEDIKGSNIINSILTNVMNGSYLELRTQVTLRVPYYSQIVGIDS